MLRDREYEPLPGSTNPRGEHWVAKDGYPKFFPYAGPPFNGQSFDKEAFDEILAGH
jgi:hypothetical protein